MILVIGTPDSGKSEFAEKLASEMGNGMPMAYIATMIPYGEEGRNRIKKHKKLREGKNFIIFEEAYSMDAVSKEIKNKQMDTVLLECVSNLVGNVIHSHENDKKEAEELIDKIADDIYLVSEDFDKLVVVANYFEINDEYDSDTVRYITINNAVNDRLKVMANKIFAKENGEWTSYDND